MATTTTVRLTLPHTLAQLNQLSDRVNTGDPKTAIQVLEDLLSAMKSGAVPGAASLEFQIGGTAAVRASQTYTFSATATAAKVFTINGQAIVAHATVTANNQFAIGASKEASAAALAAAINASSTAAIAKTVYATVSGAAVTVWAKSVGTCANALTTTTDDAGCTAGGATLAGGAGDDVVPVLLTLG